ncbi:D-alanyl-D-alanine carboxypeptidase [Thermobrachium celere DSM 8682]|uniref:D-alanyl-D-alanine carboxypeptidase n=2 Tax=Thermobrachium TaxID=150333 RepID=R7RS40_9CLOT|nr:D-alanyl-D-alanine carboxypeptidase [Thermobrachium celere DSM 8682]
MLKLERGAVMKRLIVLICLSLILIIDNKIVFAQDLLNLRCKSAVLIDAESGKVLYEKNKDERLPIASITKLMTFYTFVEELGEEYINGYLTYNIDNSKYKKDEPILDIKAGERIKTGDLITAMLVFSANNAPDMLVNEYERVKKENFIEKMNQTAKKLGLNDTYYVNPSGLTKENKYNISTAYDQARLSYYILKKHKDILRYTSKKYFDYNGKRYYSTNKLLGNYHGLDGLKTGYTKEAGYCLISTLDASKYSGNSKPLRFITVVLGCSSDAERFVETRKLLDYAKNNFENYVLDSEKTFEVKNTDYVGDLIKLKPSGDVYILKNKHESPELSIKLNDKLNRKIRKNDVIGRLFIKTSIGTKEVDLISVNDYTRKSLFFRLFQHIKNLFKNMGWFGWIELKKI